MQFEIKWDAQWGGLVFIYASKLLMIVYCTNKIDTMSPFWWLLANKVDNKIITLSFWLGLSHDLLCNDGWQWQDIVASRCRPTWDDVDTAVWYSHCRLKALVQATNIQAQIVMSYWLAYQTLCPWNVVAQCYTKISAHGIRCSIDM